MENKIEKLLKLENGDREKVNKILSHLKHILKETQPTERGVKPNEKTVLSNETETSSMNNVTYKTNKHPNGNNDVNFKSTTENDLDIIDNGNKPCVLEPNITEFYNEHINNDIKLKDVAENHQILSGNVDLSHEGEIGKSCEQVTDTTSEIVNLGEPAESNKCNYEDNNNIFQSTNQLSTNVDDLDFGINELLLIVEEYAELKEKYLKLETSVGCKPTCESNDQLGHNNTNISLEKIKTLQLENQR